MARQQELAPIYGSNGKKKDGISVGFLWDFYGIWDSKSGSDEDWRYRLSMFGLFFRPMSRNIPTKYGPKYGIATGIVPLF